MPQFALYRNRNPASRARYPLLLDVQSDLLEPLGTRVVVPLAVAGTARPRAMQTLTPILKFEGKEYLMLTPQIAGVPASELGSTAGDLAAERATILTTIDSYFLDFEQNRKQTLQSRNARPRWRSSRAECHRVAMLGGQPRCLACADSA